MNRGSTTPTDTVSTPQLSAMLGQMVFLLLLTVLVSSIGTLTRSPSSFALVWPANALLLGIFLRKPEMAGTTGWIAIALGFLAANLLTNDEPLVMLWLTSANMLGIATGYLLFQLLPPQEQRLERASGLLYLAGISGAAALAGAIAGAGSTPAVLDHPAWAGFTLWVGTEWLSFVTLLPVILTAPSLRRLIQPTYRPRRIRWHAYQQLLPALAFLALTALSAVSGDRMMMTWLPLLALLWCGYRYPVFPTTLLALVYACWQLFHVWESLLLAPVQPADTIELALLRTGLGTIILLPTLVALHQRHQRRTQRHLENQTMLDPLTQVFSSNAFQAKGNLALDALSRQGLSATIGVLDIDQMRAFNARRDHVTGDAAICAVAQFLRQNLRQDDLLGRVGDDEFAFIAAYISEADALRLADRLCAGIAASYPGAEDPATRLTISLGLLHTSQVPPSDLGLCLAAARHALRDAKNKGGNCAVATPWPDQPMRSSPPM